jgi:carbamoyltransferase
LADTDYPYNGRHGRSVGACAGIRLSSNDLYSVLRSKLYILGISAFYHDSAACLIQDGIIVAAAQEERFSRIKHDDKFPIKAIQYCVKEAGIDASKIDYVAFYEKPFLKFERLLETYLAFAPRGFHSFVKAMPLWIKEKLFQKSMITKGLERALGGTSNWQEKLRFCEHHMSHAASAFYPSPFQNAAILTIDGVGEWTTTSIAVGDGKNIEIKKEIRFPHSIGLLYSAFTFYTGFKVNSGEYKVMGLAPYGTPKYADLIRDNLISICDDGSFQLDMSYFRYCTDLTMTSAKFHKLFGGAPRQPEAELTQRHMDLASSVQAVTEEVVLKLARGIVKETGERNLCLAGGVALNCVANGVLRREKIFDAIWVQPAAGDAGGALGAALAIQHLELGHNRIAEDSMDQMQGAFLGPSFTTDEIETSLNKHGAAFRQLNENDLLTEVAQSLVAGKAVGWMQGRMEYGPRALGARSIIADPRSPSMQKQLNLKIKYRESFRPFAPSILADHVSEWFEHENDSPYMLFVADLKPHKRIENADIKDGVFGIDKLNVARSLVPAITHVDYSARIQTVHAETNPKYHALIERFYDITGCPMVVNTSFNVRGEPIICSPEDAMKCFMGTELDVLVIENFILLKEDQDPKLAEYYGGKFEKD